jgi:thioredoxin reductase
VKYDVIIVGGGPAGLSAALMLGRCRRAVLLIDAGTPRNIFAKELHGFLTRDGIAPKKLLGLARSELKRYNVVFKKGVAVNAVKKDTTFIVTLGNGKQYESRKLVLATGLCDDLPAIEGLRSFYGISVHHCQYCDGWEWHDKTIAVYGKGKGAVGQALSLRTWSNSVVACIQDIPDNYRRLLTRKGIQVYERPVSKVLGTKGKLKQVVFDDGSSIKADALFFNTDKYQKSHLARKLGCSFTEKGGVQVDKRERTGVPGLFVIGDTQYDVQLVVTAAAHGATAAVAINGELQREEGFSL